MQQRLDAEREKEIGLLEAVLAGDGAEAKENAAAQKEELLRRMETEAQARFILDGLGAASAVCCGAGMITVFLEEIAGTDTEQMVRLHEAVCSQTGMAADNVKIILVKNET
ncbi:MAG: hypothetical protein J6K32_01310 [Clostridia bacterium]|nr:hypothetical protein [Clostridia bacterium]